MSVGILIITHSGIGGALLNVAYGTFGEVPVDISHLSVCRNPEPEALTAKASHLVRKLDSGDGVLVLTDMFGSTPGNIAHVLQQQGHAIRVVAGLNLPMLFRILNYSHLPLNQLAKKAVSGGKEGIFEPMTGHAIAHTQEIMHKKNNTRFRREKNIIVID
jgi:mannose PTS system EIIA component